MARLRLFCFPCAGGGPSTFYTWPNELPSDIEIIAIQLPGVERRVMESPIESISEVVRRLLPEIYSELDKPFAFFGHSLGALVSFELTHELQKRHGLQPIRLFVAGKRAPQILNWNPPIHDLPDTDFLEKLQSRYGGIPEQILGTPDVVQLFLPGLKASLKMDESYRYKRGQPLLCDITAFCGYQDNTAPKADMESWSHQTKRSFTLHMIPGNHFFINSNQEQLLHILSDELIGILSRLG